MDGSSNFYKKAILEPLTLELEENYLIFKNLVPPGKKLKFRAKEREKQKIKQDLFEFSYDEKQLPENISDEEDTPWLDKDFAFQLAYEMEDIKSIKWYERIVERCDRLKERQLLLRARGEVMELKNTEEEPKNKGAYFSRLVRTYAEQRGISLGDYASSMKNKDDKVSKREFIKRKRQGLKKFIKEIKDTMTIEELCNYHALALDIIKKEHGQFFKESGVDIPSYIINSYVNKVIAKDYGCKFPDL